MRLNMHSRGRWVILVALAAVVIAEGAVTHSLKPLIDAVIRSGPGSDLPIHLSVLLGVTRVEQSTAVKQAVLRDGALVRTFNVCVANHDDVVMMVYNEKSRAARAYLSSPAGILRKAVSYEADEPATVRPLGAAVRAEFAKELEFWVKVVKPQAVPR